MYCKSPIFSVVTYPAGAFITSGILFTIVPQVSSTVAGFATVIVVSGSPYTVHSFLSYSSFEYTFPIHSDSIVIPSSVSVVTTALIPVASPAFTVAPNVSEYMSSLYVVGTVTCVCDFIVSPSFEHNHPFTFHMYDGKYSPDSIIFCLSSSLILSTDATCLSNSSNVSPAPCAFANAIP